MSVLRCTTAQPGSWASVPRSSSANLVDDGERDGTGRIGEGLAPPSRAGEAEVEGGPEPLVPMETHSESAHVVGETEDDSSLAIELAGENVRDGQRGCFWASRRYRGARGEADREARPLGT